VIIVDDEQVPTAKKRAMEALITACFRAGFEAGASGQYQGVEVAPIIEWRGRVPQITGFKVD
jgi:hypothetical protein